MVHVPDGPERPDPEATPATVGPTNGGAPIERLLAHPRRFSFDAALRVLTHVQGQPDPADAARFASAPGLAFPGADVTAASPGLAGEPPRVTAALIGLTGPSGVLPRHYTEAVVTSLRDRSRALHDFLDALSHRMVAFFARAGAKYRLHRIADTAALQTPGGAARSARDAASGAGPVADALLALTGYGTPHLADRLPTGSAPLQHYAGLFAARPRSADRLASLASDWLGRPVEVEQFVGAWLALPPDQRTRLAVGIRPGVFSQLGEDAAIGVRAWDVQARFVLRVGPLDLPAFQVLLPDRPALREFVSLVRAYVGFEVGFAVNPVLARDAVPPLALRADGHPSPRLGWNTWLSPGPAGRRRSDAADALFEAELVERRSA